MTKAGEKLIEAVEELRDWVDTLSTEDVDRLVEQRRREKNQKSEPRYETINGIRVWFP